MCLWLSEYSTLYIQTKMLKNGCHFENGGHVESGDCFYIGFGYPKTLKA